MNIFRAYKILRRDAHALVFVGRSGGGPSFTYALAVEGGDKFSKILISFKNELLDQFILDFEEKTTAFSLPHSFSEVGKAIYLLRLVGYILFNFKKITITHYTPYLFVFMFVSPFVDITYYMHDVVPHKKSLSQRLNHFLAALCCKNIFVISDYQYKKYHFPGKDKVKVVQHPLYHHYHSRNFSAKTARVSRAPFLFFGRIDSYKDFRFLINLENLVDCHVVNIVGGGVLDSTYKTLNCCRVYNDYVEDASVPELISSCEYLLLPYFSATQSGLFPLAKTFNKKVICTDLEVFREQACELEVTTIYAPADDPGAFARVLYNVSKADNFQHKVDR